MPSIWVTVGSSSLVIVGVLLLIVLIVRGRALISVLLIVIVPVPLVHGSLLPELLLIPAVVVHR
jgi:hypothetical protein